MKNEVGLEEVLHIYEKEISRNVRNKNKLYNFEKNKMQNVYEIIDVLNYNVPYHVSKYNIFMISEPKHRIVMSLNIKDKVINHYVSRNYLEKNLTRYLDDRNIATRKNMGTDYGIKLIKKYLELNKKYGMFYILKLDISKYFYSIDHEILLGMLKKRLTQDEYDFMKIIIDSTDEEYINLRIKDIKEKYVKKFPYLKEEISRIPEYKNGKGLPIGNMTSQFLSIFYLNELDHYIVHNLHIKHYVRYMDDFILIHPDKEVLKNAYDYIKNTLEVKYKLKLNNKKTKITNCKEGFSFLGYTFKVINKKTIIKIKRDSYEKIKRNVKKTKYLYKNKKITYNQAFCSIMCYQFNKKYASYLKVKRVIDKYWFGD